MPVFDIVLIRMGFLCCTQPTGSVFLQNAARVSSNPAVEIIFTRPMQADIVDDPGMHCSPSMTRIHLSQPRLLRLLSPDPAGRSALKMPTARGR